MSLKNLNSVFFYLKRQIFILKFAATLLLFPFSYSISYWDSACQLPIPNNELLIPFAFLTHTHGLGIHSSGWIVRNDIWTLLGEANPQVKA